MVSGNARAFVAVKTDGSIITWGHAKSGGDSGIVADQLSVNA